MSIKLNSILSPRAATPAMESPTLKDSMESVPRTGPERLLPQEAALWDQLSVSEVAVLQSPSDPQVTQYLDTVRDLLNQALKRHQARSATYWSPKGRFRQMVHIVEVNRALDDLLNDIRLHHPATQIARRLDAIRGLLLDLWM